MEKKNVISCVGVLRCIQTRCRIAILIIILIIMITTMRSLVCFCYNCYIYISQSLSHTRAQMVVDSKQIPIYQPTRQSYTDAVLADWGRGIPTPFFARDDLGGYDPNDP